MIDDLLLELEMMQAILGFDKFGNIADENQFIPMLKLM